MNIFEHISEILWDKKTDKISFEDVNGVQWRGKGHIKILERLPVGFEIELKARMANG